MDIRIYRRETLKNTKISGVPYLSLNFTKKGLKHLVQTL
jgi:hypothetical protein